MYENLGVQKYMVSPLFDMGEVNTLHAKRSIMIECKANCKQKFLNVHLLCQLCGQHLDEQKEMLNYKEIRKNIITKEIALAHVEIRLKCVNIYLFLNQPRGGC